MQCAKKVVSDSPGLVDFAIAPVNSVLNLPDGQVKYFWGIQPTEQLWNNFCSSKTLGGLVEMTFGLVNASFTLPKLQAVKMTFFAHFSQLAYMHSVDHRLLSLQPLFVLFLVMTWFTLSLIIVRFSLSFLNQSHVLFWLGIVVVLTSYHPCLYGRPVYIIPIGSFYFVWSLLVQILVRTPKMMSTLMFQVSNRLHHGHSQRKNTLRVQ